MWVWVDEFYSRWVEISNETDCTVREQCWNEYLVWDESNIEYYGSDENWMNWILFACQQNIQILFKHLQIFEYILINLEKMSRFQNPKFLQTPKTPFNWLSLI